jgi:succinate-semialdehyde dehydrogenase/glutarate-semialdehyde dehydrogenase
MVATATATLKRMYIDGKWVDADNGRTLGVINPATEEVICEVAYGGRAETRKALEAACWMHSWPG